jgi:hypothetical protein
LAVKCKLLLNFMLCPSKALAFFDGSTNFPVDLLHTTRKCGVSHKIEAAGCLFEKFLLNWLSDT